MTVDRGPDPFVDRDRVLFAGIVGEQQMLAVVVHANQPELCHLTCLLSNVGAQHRTLQGKSAISTRSLAHRTGALAWRVC